MTGWGEILLEIILTIAVVAVGVFIMIIFYPLNHLWAILGGAIVILVGIASILMLLVRGSNSS